MEGPCWEQYSEMESEDRCRRRGPDQARTFRRALDPCLQPPAASNMAAATVISHKRLADDKEIDTKDKNLSTREGDQQQRIAAAAAKITSLRALAPVRDAQWAARTLQNLARARTASKHRLRRNTLHDRLKLESTLLEGLRVIILSLGLFSVLLLILRSQTNTEARFGLRKTYQDVFELESIAEIATVAALQDYLKQLSTKVRSVQVLSSDYFVEKEGELKIVSGIEDFSEPAQLEVAGLMPRISPSFSFVAWVQRSSTGKGYVVQKPLGNSDAESELSCYGWWMGRHPRLDFGAHDFGGLGQDYTDQGQESAHAEGDWWSDGLLHLEVVVVNQSAVSFFQDALLRSVVPIRRPVTDCTGKAIVVGGEGLRLGEVTYFARSLTATEIEVRPGHNWNSALLPRHGGVAWEEEIFFAGFTLEAIAAGKLPFAPQETEFDHLRSAQLGAFATAQVERSHMHTQAQYSTVLSQAVSQATQTAAAPRNVIAVAPQAGCSRGWPTCNVITDVAQTLATDPLTGRDFYDLTPPSLRNGAAAQSRLYVPGSALFAHFDPATFPRWKGQSVTFMAWVRADAGTGYLLTKSPDFEKAPRCWTFHLEQNGLANIGGAVVDGWTHPYAWALLPEDLDYSFASSTALRHVAQVLDAESNSIRGYLDGQLFGETVFEEAGAVARLDCDITERGYIGFGHRAPGSGSFQGDVQDMRMYIGAPLTDEQIHTVAMAGALRECKLLSEGADSQFADINGHDCAWYQEAKATSDSICSSDRVREECPVACEAFLPCYEPRASEPPPVHQIWERVMHLVPNENEQEIVCVRAGLEEEVVRECRRLAALRDPRSYPPDSSAVLFKSWHAYLGSEKDQQVRSDVNVTDCDILERKLNPFCSFSPAGGWTRGFDAEVEASGAMTMTMWFKAVSDDTLIDGKLDPNIMLLSSVAPPVPVIAFYIRKSGLVFATVWGGCGERDREDALIGHPISTDRWVHVSVVFGSMGADGRRRMMVVVDSVMADDLSPWQWCPQSSGETVQAVVATPELLVSPIRFRAEALTPKQLQAEYYSLRPAFRRIRGPSVSDAARLAERIQYERPAFNSPGAMVAPPILLQTRGAPGECASEQGNAFLRSMWADAVHGSTCAPPYLCGAELLASSSELLRCSLKGGGSEIASYFGRPALELSGERVFSEFLPSIADATVLVRDGSQFETATFIDSTTEKVRVLLVVFAPQHSIVTTVSITARIGAAVSAGYEMLHLSSVEGSELRYFTALVIVSGVLIFFNLAEIIYHTVAHVRHRREHARIQQQKHDAHLNAVREVKAKQGLRSWSSASLAPSESNGGSAPHLGKQKSFSLARALSSVAEKERTLAGAQQRALAAAKDLRLLAVDLFVLVLFPLAFLAVRLWQARDSATRLIDTVGTGGLGSVPWASKEVGLEEKMERFFGALEDLQDKIRGEQQINVIGFFVGLFLLLRCILATKVHPRIAVLVNTLGSAADDLWHFVLLFLLMFCGFAGLASICFGGEREEFATLSTSFETLFDMTLGEVPIEGDGRSNVVKWSSDPLMIIFVVLFNFLIFFVMLNFIIAIIVEAYLNAKKVVEKDETEQEFFTDCLSAIGAFIKGRIRGWPPHWRLVEAMSECVRYTVGIDNLTVYFPNYRREALLSVVRHYEGFDFIVPEPTAPVEKELTLQDVVDEVELRTATLLNLPVLSAGDRVIRQDLLNKRKHRRTSNLSPLGALDATSHGGSSPVPGLSPLPPRGQSAPAARVPAPPMPGPTPRDVARQLSVDETEPLLASPSHLAASLPLSPQALPAPPTLSQPRADADHAPTDAEAAFLQPPRAPSAGAAALGLSRHAAEWGA